MKKVTNYDLHRLKERATTLFKEKHFVGYDPELQHVICILLTFIVDYEARTGTQLDFELESPTYHEPID